MLRNIITILIISINISCSYKSTKLITKDKNNYWQVSSKISVTNKIPYKKNMTANIIWQQQGNNYNIKLLGLLHITLATIEGNNKTAKITTTNGTIISGEPQHLMQQLIGIKISPLELKQLLQFNDSKTTTRNLINKQLNINYQKTQMTIFGNRPQKMKIQHPNFILKLANMRWKTI